MYKNRTPTERLSLNFEATGISPRWGEKPNDWILQIVVVAPHRGANSVSEIFLFTRLSASVEHISFKFWRYRNIALLVEKAKRHKKSNNSVSEIIMENYADIY